MSHSPDRARFVQDAVVTKFPVGAEAPMRTLTLGIIGAATLAAGLVLVRQQRAPEVERPRVVPAGESQPAEISLERIRALGY